MMGRRIGKKLDYPRSNLPTFPSDRIGDTPPKCPLEPTTYRTRGTVPRKITGGYRGAVISTFRPKLCCASSLLLVTFQGSVPCQCRNSYTQLYAWGENNYPSDQTRVLQNSVCVTCTTALSGRFSKFLYVRLDTFLAPSTRRAM